MTHDPRDAVLNLGRAEGSGVSRAAASSCRVPAAAGTHLPAAKQGGLLR